MVATNIFPLSSILSLALPEVSNWIVSALGNLIAVFVSPVCTILSAISTSPVNVPVVPDTAPLNVPVVLNTTS